MSVYLTFAEYAAMGGDITDEVVFDDYNFTAQKTVDHYTFSRLTSDTTFPIAIKRAIKKLIDYYASMDAQKTEDGRTVSSQSNDGVSVSFVAVSPDQAQTQTRDYEALTVKRFLDGEKNEAGVSLLYRGLP